jgi:hypothetical protein
MLGGAYANFMLDEGVDHMWATYRDLRRHGSSAAASGFRPMTTTSHGGLLGARLHERSTLKGASAAVRLSAGSFALVVPVAGGQVWSGRTDVRAHSWRGRLAPRSGIGSSQSCAVDDTRP